MDKFSIRAVTTMEEIHGIVEIQRQAWNMPELEIVATFEMKAVCDFGVVLVALDEKNKPIGFIYALPEFPNYHYSHMMATLPEWQSKGVGYAMKRYHYNLAKQGEFHIDRIRWTVDPLLPNNAYLNFTKLGGVCSKYYVNYYGDPEKIGIYQGIPTDRLLLEWHIHDPRVVERMENFRHHQVSQEELAHRAPAINTIVNDEWVDTDPQINQRFSVQIPSDYQELKIKDLEKALDWRIKFRDLCVDRFNQGWQIIDYHSCKYGTERLNLYEFHKLKVEN